MKQQSECERFSTKNLRKPFDFKKKQADFRKEYLKLKEKACIVCKTIFGQNQELVRSFNKVSELDGGSNDKGIFECALMYGDGDTGHGYYRLHLILNMKNYELKKYEDIVYIAVSYVPAPDNGYSWEVDEIHQRDMSNFSPVSQFIDYLKLLSEPDTALIEYNLLSERKYSTPVENIQDRKISIK
ncbi:MAG: hypothetical protein KBB91_01795 [Candidatus Pacebacteria bacterium]|nr:hypothetical protein [Candidatus Paceibacterota bacterium]MBP9701253.1 hypothetical protein [Candidatus Paceibacterota bacterium]